MRFNLMLPFLVLSVTLERPKPADVALPAADYGEKDPWTPRVAAAASTLGEHFSTDEILDRLDLAPEERGQVASRRVGRILGHLGYASKSLRTTDGGFSRRWVGSGAKPSPDDAWTAHVLSIAGGLGDHFLEEDLFKAAGLAHTSDASARTKSVLRNGGYFQHGMEQPNGSYPIFWIRRKTTA